MTFVGTAWSVAPALLAVGLAIATHRVYLSLAAAVVAGALLMTNLQPVPAAHALLTHYLIAPFTGSDKLKLLAFTLVLGATVGIMNASGGTRGMVGRLVRYASTRARAQIMAGLGGLVIFFDDYANCLILGPTFLPVFDRLGLSREKLAYIVDSTGAADASFALISTWIGFELGLIGDALKTLPDPALASLSPYALFVTSIPYRFYLHLATALIFVIAILGRDFGPMLTAERRALAARRHARVRKEREAHWTVGTIPILLLVGLTVWELLSTGRAKLAADGRLAGAGLREIIGAADSYQSMLTASLASLLAALALAAGPGGFRGRPLLHAIGQGTSIMLPPLVILILAWALGDLCRDLKTGAWVGATLGAATKPWMLSTAVFLIACVMSFATGTSWGTMAVLMPVAVPLAYASVTAAGLAPAAMQDHLMLTIAAVLAGAVFGDHCGLISDTTILAALSSKCPLYEHFRTQVPYAVLAALITVAAGTLPSSLGVPWWVCLPVGMLLLVLAVRVIGRPVRA